MILIGGTYKEINDYANTHAIYGSGIRALETLLEFGNQKHIDYYTCCHSYERTVRIRHPYADKISWHITDSPDVSFHYIHPFNLSGISPRPDYFIRNRSLIEAEGIDVLVFGMIESDFKIKAKRVVYDPQSSVAPLLFSQTGSSAEELVYVLNIHEAKTLTGLDDIKQQAEYLFSREDCKALVIKNGAKGAYVFDGSAEQCFLIPVYETPKVNCVGTGDVFSATFANFWFIGMAAVDAAIIASKTVACYADSGNVRNINERLQNFDYPELTVKNNGRIYLAGPFFSFSERWLICEFYNALCQEGIDVFSPLHNVGIGGDETAAIDIEGLEKSSVVLAVADGLDAGTMFEVGYARKRGIPVIVFNSCEDRSDLQMLSGTGCDIIDDFASAVYTAIWYATK